MGRIDLLEMLNTLEEPSAFHIGQVVCIERSGRPWRLARIQALSDTSLTVETGHEYAVDTGLPYDDSTGRRLLLLKREHVEYLLMLELGKMANRIVVSKLTVDQRQQLLPAAITVATLWREVNPVSPSAPQQAQRAVEPSK